MPERMTSDLRAIDLLDVPDLWPDVSTRTPRPGPSREGRSPAKRLAAGITATVIFLSASVWFWVEVRTGDEPVNEQVVSSVLDDLPEGWTDLGPMPRDPTATTVWTGSELIVWGGGGEDGPGPLRADGFRFDPSAGETASIPEAPIDARANPASAWTGKELLIWGGWSEGPPFFFDGAAYNPTTDKWRTLPPAPISARVPLSAWTGTEWLLWGTSVRVDDRPLDGAAYDPTTDTWRPIAEGPLEFTDATAMWTGEEFVVVGAALHGGNYPETPTAIAAAYDPATDTWRELPASPLDPNSNTAVWTGERIVGIDYNHVTAMYDPVTDVWTEMGKLPGSQCEGGLGQARAAQGWVLISDCGTTAVLPPGETTWSVPVDAPEVYYAQTVSADGAVILFARPAGGGDASLLVFRPPADAARLATRFYPDATREGFEGRVMPVTFPDGATATLRFPYYLEVDTSGASPSVSWLWTKDPPPRYAIEFAHGAKASVSLLEGDSPVGEVVDATGIPRELWRINGADEGETGIVFELPEWTVVIPTGGFEPEAVARAFSVVQDENRFPVVTAEAPFELSKETGEGASARLTLGTVILEPGNCELRPIDRTDQEFAATCAADGIVTVSMYGVPTDYAREVVNGIQVEDFVPAP